MGHSREDCEKLVMLADDTGTVTYKDIQKAFPGTSSSFLYDWIGDSFKGIIDYRALMSSHNAPMLFWANCPENYNARYEFKPTDTFTLSVPGENLRYELKKSEEQSRISMQTLWWAKVSAVFTLVGILIAIWQLVKG